MRDYTDVLVPTLNGETAIDCTAVPIRVKAAFHAEFSAPRGFHAEVRPPHFQPPRDLRYTSASVIDRNTPDNHFQGVQRIGDYLLVTGSDWTESRAHLFVVRTKRDAAGEPVAGELVRVLAIDDRRPHPGGCQRLGDLLAVPLEGKKVDSCVRFLHVGNPEKPAFVGGASTIDRPGRPKAGAAALARLPDGRFLAGVWWEESRGVLFWRKKKALLDLYLSNGTDVRQGFRPAPVTVEFGSAIGRTPSYQAIAFLAPERVEVPGTDPEVQLWMVGLWNTQQDTSDFIRGKNYADLVQVRLPLASLDAWGSGAPPRLAFAGERPFVFPRGDGNFSAAAGVDVEPGNRLAVYAGHHWRVGDRIPFCFSRSAS